MYSLTLAIVFNRRIMLRNISSSFAGIWEISRRICPVWASGTRNVSLSCEFSSTIPDQGNKCRILNTRTIRNVKYNYVKVKVIPILIGGNVLQEFLHVLVVANTFVVFLEVFQRFMVVQYVSVTARNFLHVVTGARDHLGKLQLQIAFCVLTSFF